MHHSDTAETVAYIGLGSNIGDREALLREAIRLLNHCDGVQITTCSGVYETEPVGYVEQPPFLNMVVELRTELPADLLLKRCFEVEQRLDRRRDVRWGPRTIDLDLLLYEGFESATPEMTIPHPRMKERLFVLIPLMEILRRSSRYYDTFHNALRLLEGKAGVRLWKKCRWLSESGHFAN